MIPLTWDRIAAIEADYVAMDIKTAPERYHLVGGARPPRVRDAIAAVRESPVCEFRTTVAPGIVTEEDIRAIVALLKPGDRYTLTAFRPGRTLDPSYADAPAPAPGLLAHYEQIARDAGLDVHVRNHRTRNHRVGDRDADGYRTGASDNTGAS